MWDLPDVSVLDSIVGVVVGFALFLFIFLMMLKYNIVCFGVRRPEENGGSRYHCVYPETCKEHLAESERSHENKSDIEKLDQEFHDFKKAVFNKLDAIQTTVTEVRIALAEGGIRHHV